MKKNHKTRLAVKTETVRILSAAELARVAGGDSALCPSNSCNPCSLNALAGCCSTNYTHAVNCPTYVTC